MTKTELIAVIAEKTGTTKKLTHSFLEAFEQTVVETVVSGDKVQIVDFITIQSANRAERNGRNPQTGEALVIPARTVPKAVFGRAFKKAVANQ